MTKTQNESWIIHGVAIICMACVACTAIIVFGMLLAYMLAEGQNQSTEAPGLEIHFESSFIGTEGEQGYSNGVSFVTGYTGQAALFQDESSLYYLADNNIRPDQGAIEFWIKPLWNGNDNQNYVFFEIGDSWFNRFRLAKDGANNFRFMVWSPDTEYGAACNVSKWVAGEWHHVRATWQRDIISLYLDNVHCDTKRSAAMPEILSARLFIGSSVAKDLHAQAVIDELIIYAKP
jgi:hypothetical protein